MDTYNMFKIDRLFYQTKHLQRLGEAESGQLTKEEFNKMKQVCPLRSCQAKHFQKHDFPGIGGWIFGHLQKNSRAAWGSRWEIDHRVKNNKTLPRFSCKDLQITPTWRMTGTFMFFWSTSRLKNRRFKIATTNYYKDLNVRGKNKKEKLAGIFNSFQKTGFFSLCNEVWLRD